MNDKTLTMEDVCKLTGGGLPPCSKNPHRNPYLPKEFREKYEDGEVNHPSHYQNHPSGVECIDISEHYDFCLGNVIKYVWRANQKYDDPILDLKKAKWYLERKISRLEEEERERVALEGPDD